MVVAASAVPSAALTGNVSSGILTVSTSPLMASSLDPGSAPCRGVGSTTLDLVSTTLTMSDPFTYAGATYFFTLESEAAVTLSAGTMSMGPMYLTIMMIYPETSPGSCVADLGDPLCSTLTTYGFDWLTLSGPWTGTSATLSGSFDIDGSFCLAPFGGLGTAKTLTISDMVVDF